MKDESFLTASKMNSIRYLFAKKCNNLCSIIINAQQETNKTANNLFTPILTDSFKQVFYKSLRNMKIKSTDTVSFLLTNYIINEKSNLKEESSQVRTRRFSKNIIEILEASFYANEYPTDSEKQDIAKICKITTKQVNNWFTNKRNRAKNSRSGSKKI